MTPGRQNQQMSSRLEAFNHHGRRDEKGPARVTLASPCLKHKDRLVPLIFPG